MRVFPHLLVGGVQDVRRFFFGEEAAFVCQCCKESLLGFCVRFYRSQVFAYVFHQGFFVYRRTFHFHIESNVRYNRFLIAFQYAFCHEEVECRNRLSSVLLVLVGLEDNGSQCGIALDRLGRADASVLGMESPFE